jgi:hypothetical protein
MSHYLLELKQTENALSLLATTGHGQYVVQGMLDLYFKKRIFTGFMSAISIVEPRKKHAGNLSSVSVIRMSSPPYCIMHRT